MTARTARWGEGISREALARSRHVLLALIGTIGLAFCSGCVGVVRAEPVYGHAHPACNVPPGHLPPPGECRLWYPGLPSGQQPPPGDCYELEHHAPTGACLVYGE